MKISIKYDKKIENLAQKCASYKPKPSFEDLGIQEVGYSYFCGIKGIEKVM